MCLYLRACVCLCLCVFIKMDGFPSAQYYKDMLSEIIGKMRTKNTLQINVKHLIENRYIISLQMCMSMYSPSLSLSLSLTLWNFTSPLSLSDAQLTIANASYMGGDRERARLRGRSEKNVHRTIASYEHIYVYMYAIAS